MSEQLAFRPNIAFAGLTAAGKTTHAKLLAAELGYEYVSATQTILDILDMQDDPDGIWFSKYDEIEKAREDDRVDIELESRMQQHADTTDGLILDTWAMAWKYNGHNPMVRLWLNSDEESRTRKCFVSQGSDPQLDLDQCNDLINLKDSDTRTKFQYRLNFDLFTDMDRYDILLDNSALISEPTQAAAERGIATFAPVVRAAVGYAVRLQIEPGFDSDRSQAENLLMNNNGMIQRIGGVALA